MKIIIKGADFKDNNLESTTISKYYSVTYSGAGVSSSSAPKSIAYGDDNYATQDLVATIKVLSSYTFNSVSSVSVGGTTLLTSDYTVSGQTVTVPANKVNGNVVIAVSATAVNTGGGSGDTGGDEPVVPDNPSTTITLYQGYANETSIATLPTRVRTDVIEGAFSVEVNSGYLIRAIFEYSTPPNVQAGTASSGKSIVAASEKKTSYTKTANTGYAIITFCNVTDTANISPSENIIKSFTGKIYQSTPVEPDEPETPTTGTVVNGIEISMGQILGTSLNTASKNRAYTVTPLNDKNKVTTTNDFIGIPLIDEDDTLTNGATYTLGMTNGNYDKASKSYTYLEDVDLSKVKALAGDSDKIYVMFKKSDNSNFDLTSLINSLTIS